MCMKYGCCFLKYSGYLEEKHLGKIFVLIAELAAFYFSNFFFLKKVIFFSLGHAVRLAGS